jgi:hypothetical protein
MNELADLKIPGDCLQEGPQWAMEKMLLEEYLAGRGYTLADLNKLPEAVASTLMAEACRYASLKLAQVESTAHFREKVRRPMP